MALAPLLVRVRRPFLPFAAGWLGLLVGAFLGLVLLGPAPPRPAPIPAPLRALAEAQREARRNCLVARRTPDGRAARPRFQVGAQLEALEGDDACAGELGELEAIRSELRWLGGLRPGAPLGGRSWEDVRFLTGLLHWYLDGVARRAAGPQAPPSAWAHREPAPYDPAALREFRGQDFLDVLGAWD